MRELSPLLKGLKPAKKQSRTKTNTINTIENSIFTIDTNTIFEVLHVKHLGEGAYGTVKKAKRILVNNNYDNHNFFVAKKFRLLLGQNNIPDDDNELQITSAYNEFEIISRLGQPAYLTYRKHEKTKIHKTKNTQYTHTLYLFSPFLGDSLYSRLEKGGLDFNTKITIAIQLIDAVISLHNKNIAHGDIKPQNITLDDQNQLHLIDFGLSKKFNNKKTKCDNNTNYPYWPTSGIISPGELDTFSVFRSIYMPQRKNLLDSIFTDEDLKDHQDLKNILNTENGSAENISLTDLRKKLIEKAPKQTPLTENSQISFKKPSPYLYRGIYLCLTSAAIFTLIYSGILPAAVTSLAMLMLITKILAGALGVFGVMNMSAGALQSTDCCRPKLA
jgi:serine/threonine protein kinase